MGIPIIIPRWLGLCMVCGSLSIKATIDRLIRCFDAGLTRIKFGKQASRADISRAAGDAENGAIAVDNSRAKRPGAGMENGGGENPEVIPGLAPIRPRG